jgi:hypothetical protein
MPYRRERNPAPNLSFPKGSGCSEPQQDQL